MAPQHPTSPQGRDLALRRLRRLTLGAAIGSLAAVAGLGTLAAATYSGHTKTSATTSATQSSSGSSDSSSGSTSSSGSSTLQSPSQAPASASGGTASVSSGGS
jgi:hypothetical protein